MLNIVLIIEIYYLLKVVKGEFKFKIGTLKFESGGGTSGFKFKSGKFNFIPD